jgi:hypothetical protein
MAAATINKVLFALLAACGVRSDSPQDSPDELPDGHNEVRVKDNVYFCCHDVELKTASGEGCVTIGEKQIDQCSTVLACADGFVKKGGVVTCL